MEPYIVENGEELCGEGSGVNAEKVCFVESAIVLIQGMTDQVQQLPVGLKFSGDLVRGIKYCATIGMRSLFLFFATNRRFRNCQSFATVLERLPVVQQTLLHIDILFVTIPVSS